MADTNIYRGFGPDLQAAVLAAHESYRQKTSTVTSLFTTKVVSFGVESGGYAQTTTFFAEVQEASHIPQ
ncbi:MAG: hypothetical protein AB1490_05305 [Pseudomonadota bacterium]